MNLKNEIFELSLDDIMPNRFQPREVFEDESLMELAQSIKEHGVIQPIIVRKLGDKYEIVAGERRFRASKLAGKKTIPSIVRNLDDRESAKVALLENLQRKDLSPIEEAKTYQTILKIDNITQEELAKNLGKSQSSIANKIRLLNLDEEVQTALLNNEISERHARSLLPLSEQDQKKLLTKTINERLTVKQLDDQVAKIMFDDIDIDEDTKLDEPIKETKDDQNENKDSEVRINFKSDIFDKLRVENTKSKEEQDEKLNEQEKIKKNEENEKIDELIEKTIEEGSKSEKQENVKEDKNIDKIVDEVEKQKPEEQKEMINQNDTSKYDLRFAINNFRQAIQNTEKFGFKVKAEEFENKENYQLIITIHKKDDQS